MLDMLGIVSFDGSDSKLENSSNNSSNGNELSDISNNPIKEYFKLPIHYLNENRKIKIDDSTKNDIELIKCDDANKNSLPLYHHLFDYNGKSKCEKEVLELWSDCYTDDSKFIVDTRNIISKNKLLNKHNFTSAKVDEVYDLWNNIKYEDNFYEKYHFLEYSYVKFLNKSSVAMLIFSVLNITSPLFSLLSPIIMLILPFIILKMSGNKFIDFKTYINIIIISIKQHVIGRLIYNFNEISWSERVSAIFMIFMYGMQTYYNVLSMIRFHTNLDQIHSQIKELKTYLSVTIDNMKEFKEKTKGRKSYNKFNDNLEQHYCQIVKLYGDIVHINNYEWNINEISNLGSLMSNFYKLHTEENYHNSLLYTFGFNIYYHNICTLQNKFSKGIINKATIVKNKKLVMNQFSYPPIQNNSVKNSINMNTNKIITGPNASGKTTIIKSCIFNILITQQLGVGFYKSCKITPYNNIHCYLNIPDTSGRDSLFQAEARRCKEIISNVEKMKNSNHFCIFDELYSGTNPDEAVASSHVFIKSLNKKENVSYLLTTHYNELCKSLKNESNVSNYCMSTTVKDDKLIFNYKLKKGINKIKGGVQVLKQMDFPQHMIDDTICYLNSNSMNSKK